MLRYFFALIVFIHAIIHLAGFAKASGYDTLQQIKKLPSKKKRIAWLLTAVFFFIAVACYLWQQEVWWLPASIAVLVSQVLIVLKWKEAKFGTIVNVIILIAAIVGYADWNFNRMVKKEVSSLLALPERSSVEIRIGNFEKLPTVVQKWLTYSGVKGNTDIHTVRLRQKGSMKTAPDGKWMDFTAVQYFNADEPSFNWQTKVDMFPMIYLTGRDKFENGQGSMLIKLLSVKNVVSPIPSATLDQGTMLRYLAEICWFPSAALHESITWEAIDSSSALATMNYKGISVSGIFYFNELSEVTAFEAMRYGEFNGRMSLEKWHIDIKGYKTFSGINLPYKFEVSWKLRTGDFTWLKLELTDLEYNLREMY